jgi:peptide methionine sulfoxide reductase msrA/msrB
MGMASLLVLNACSKPTEAGGRSPWHELTESEREIIIHKGTERPSSGKLYDFAEKGVYLCKQCGAPLFLSEHKFKSGCGWPSFDDELEGAVKRQTDADGRRTEILCARCGGHLGHVFEGEGLTDKNLRHCVNSISMTFLPLEEDGLERGIFAGGCFWGIEHYLQKLPGVKKVVSGYTGGHVVNPTYREVCQKNTGHAEAVMVWFDPDATSYEEVAKTFFEIHDPTQKSRQGRNAEGQYRSAVFYLSLAQKQVVEDLISRLRDKGYDVVTQVAPAHEFYPAEEYHQDYYQSKGMDPACNAYAARFGE